MTSIAIFLSLLGQGDNWAEFRGPGGTGHSDAVGLPRAWSETENVVWKTALHGKGWSSPVVWGKQVWLTTGTPEGTELFVICVDRETGKVLVDAKVFSVPKADPLWMKYNSYASPTPVIEEGRVYVHFGTYGTACLDTASGKVLWKREDLPCNHFRGAGSSPILHGNLLIIHFDGFDQQYVVALDKKTGKSVWKSDRPAEIFAPAKGDGDVMKGYATPTIIEAGGKVQLVSPASQGAVALDPATGKEIWRVRYPGSHSPAARPLFGHGLVYLSTGASAKVMAVRPDGSGDVTSTHVAWSWNKGVGHKPTPLLVDDLIYVSDDKAGGLMTCLDAKTGAMLWSERVGGVRSSSPVYADGAIYLQAEDGQAVVVQAGRELKELGRGKLDRAKDTRYMATPAIAGKSLFIRGETHLYRIEKR